MDDLEIKKTADAIVKKIDFAQLFETEKTEEDQINFWLPKGYKERFKAMNKQTKRKLGKIVKSVIAEIIDAADAQRSA